jgi:hypothetical protein
MDDTKTFGRRKENHQKKKFFSPIQSKIEEPIQAKDKKRVKSSLKLNYLKEWLNQMS